MRLKLRSKVRTGNVDDDPDHVQEQSAANVSGVWLATYCMTGFVVTQSTTFPADHATLLALAFWIPIGLAVDLAIRQQSPLNSIETLRRQTSWTLWALVICSALVAIVWTTFRPSTAVPSNEAWVGPVLSSLDYAQFLLPGLKYSMNALQAAGRYDVAAYFGGFLVFCSLLFVAGVAAVSRLLGVTPLRALRLNWSAKPFDEKYQPTTFWRRAAWRIKSLLLFAIVFVLPHEIWHQFVTGAGLPVMDLVENVIKAPGAFVLTPAIVGFAIPLMAFVAARLHAQLARTWQAVLRSGGPLGK